MPELPEVETTLRGIKPHINHAVVKSVLVRHPTLRWPIPTDLTDNIVGQQIKNIERRAKYLLITFDTGTLILHLGMSGRLSVLNNNEAAKKHDHVDIQFDNGVCLRFTDPRRFGAVLFTTDNPNDHALIKNIGPEPLSKAFTGDHLWKHAANKKVPVKNYIMDGHTVAGVGNIYATEALFTAGIHPNKPAGTVKRAQYDELATAIKAILKNAIKKGGTTLKDFAQSDGKPGYFSIELQVYGRAGEPCPQCGKTLVTARIGQRASVYCTRCQK